MRRNVRVPIRVTGFSLFGLVWFDPAFPVLCCFCPLAGVFLESYFVLVFFYVPSLGHAMYISVHLVCFLPTFLFYISLLPIKERKKKSIFKSS